MSVGRSRLCTKSALPGLERATQAFFDLFYPRSLAMQQEGLIWDPLRGSRENRFVSVKRKTNLFVVLAYIEC